MFHVGHSPKTPLYPCARSQLGRQQISSGPRSSTPLLSTALRKGLGRHLDGVVRDLGLVLNSEEMTLDFFQDRRIVVDHAALPANLNGGVGNKQVFSAMAVKVFDAPFLIVVTATEIRAFRVH